MSIATAIGLAKAFIGSQSASDRAYETGVLHRRIALIEFRLRAGELRSQAFVVVPEVSCMPAPPALVDPGRNPARNEPEENSKHQDRPQRHMQVDGWSAAVERVERHVDPIAIGDCKSDEQNGGRQTENPGKEPLHRPFA